MIAHFFLIILLLIGCAEQPKPKLQAMNQSHNGKEVKLDTAIFGGGCFWCLEAVFQRLKGVHSVESGYAGGHIKNPTYDAVCSGTTGHAEVAQITFDPATISYEDLLNVFWRTHDPTTPNRQGNDVGTQYRSVIFYHSDAQKQTAEKSKKETNASGLWPNPIVTEIKPLTEFYKAENYHQNYYNSHPSQPYCTFVIDPKIKKFKELFKDKVNEEAK
jgi:peptide-methionine (S)-S-oxide reductase